MSSKPITEIRDLLRDINRDINTMQTEITHIKEYIRKDEVRKSLEDDKIVEMETEYVNENKSWWFG
tara:strand:+ start:1404 stop:1601 length:198 start_codon:yes stop_codon:yes gene_type:complete